MRGAGEIQAYGIEGNAPTSMVGEVYCCKFANAVQFDVSDVGSILNRKIAREQN